jgi:nuclear protein localization family protein 4
MFLRMLDTFPHALTLILLICLRFVLCRVGKKGWTFSDQLADFQLLLYLCDFLSASDDLPLLCRAVVDREVPLDDGYQLLIRSIAGMD